MLLQTRLLRFVEKHDEKNYRDSTLSYQRMCLRILCLTLGTQSSVIFIFNPLEIDIFKPLLIFIFLMMLMSLAFIFYLFLKRLYNHADLFILILVVSFISGAVEFFRNEIIERGILTTDLYFSFGVYLQTGCLFLIIARIEWMKSALAIIFLQLYIWIRVIVPFTAEKSLPSIYVSLSLYLILLPLLCYFGEREDRLKFIQKQLDVNHLALFQSLVTDVLPNAIIILKGESVSFFNEKTKHVLKVSDVDELLQVLNLIKVSC
jgi:hypothetical protein